MALWTKTPRRAELASPRLGDFPYLSADEVYLDSACQTLRPQVVLDAMRAYDTDYPACGGRVQYTWGRTVEDAVADTRARVLAAFGHSARSYSCAFTLNTSYGLNLLLQQLPLGRYARVITTDREHNSVFLSTMSAAQRLGADRVVVPRSDDGSVDLTGVDLNGALLVLSAMDNVTGTVTADLPGITVAVQRSGGAVIVDAAQAAAHAFRALKGLPADAICFSSHKMYGPTLGVVVARNALLESLTPLFIGGGQVTSVTRDDFVLSDELHSRLEPGLQSWAGIIGFGAALEWFLARREAIEAAEAAASARLSTGLAELPHLRMFSPTPSPVITVLPERVDAHRLAIFLSRAGVMARSGHFCAHHWLAEQRELPPLLRFSIGAHLEESDIDRALEVMGRLMRGL